jgi:hypothetical protein
MLKAAVQAQKESILLKRLHAVLAGHLPDLR